MGKYKKIQKHMNRILETLKVKTNQMGSKTKIVSDMESESVETSGIIERVQDILPDMVDTLPLQFTDSEQETPTREANILITILPVLLATTNSASFYANKSYESHEQIGEFCDDLKKLFEDLNNIQEYVKTIGIYPKTLIDRLDDEVTEVSLLMKEAKHIRESIKQTQEQRKAVREYANGFCATVLALRKEEAKELEHRLKTSDLELFKCWETVRDSTDINSFDTLLAEVKNQQVALDTVMKLVQNRVSQIKNSNPFGNLGDISRKPFRRQGKHKRPRALTSTPTAPTLPLSTTPSHPIEITTNAPNSQSTSLQLSQQTFQFGNSASRHSSNLNANFPIFRFGINNVVEEQQPNAPNMVFLTIEDRETLF